ncbi:MAG: hypothetical protein JNM75_09990 [Rhodospirillales bacterium]|nr:hypothetical protein [Rhodospirillales bacterium]
MLDRPVSMHSATRLDPVVSPLLGQVFFRPWWDALGVPLVTGMYFPLSRAWAAAAAADGDVERFASSVGLPADSARLGGRVRALAPLARRYARAEEIWQDAFFDAGVPSAELGPIARRRDRNAFRFMMARRSFIPWLRRLPAVHWDIAGVDRVWAGRGAEARGERPAYPAPPYPDVAVSAAIAKDDTRQYWLRYPSPVLADQAWAHVYEPAAASASTTMIFLHGIAVDGDMWPEPGDTFGKLLERNIRVIRPTGPWHGRRMTRGYYGGEPIIGHGMEGMLAAFQAWLAEVAVLIRWARERGSRTVVLSGVSLGSLTSQMVATAAHDWPAEMRPDALFLVATSGSLMKVALDGSLARALDVPRRLAAAGWTPETMAPFLPLLEPHGPAAVDPRRIVMVLGKADTLTPYAEGSALARRWKVPEGNVFIRHQGHFSVALGLLCDPRPIDRLLAIVAEAG